MMASLQHLLRVAVLLSFGLIRETLATPDDRCQFIFKEDHVLQVAESENAGAKVRTDLHTENKIKCAEACCESEGEWCTFAVYHFQANPEAMNCFLVQCVPDGSQEDVCITKHVRHSDFTAIAVKHPTPPTTPPPPTTPTTPPPPSSPVSQPQSAGTSTPPSSSPTTPPSSSSTSSSSSSPSSTVPSKPTPSSMDAIPTNDSAEALDDLNAALNSSLTSPLSKPAITNAPPLPLTTVAATDIPTSKPKTTESPKVSTTKAAAKPATKASITDSTLSPKWTSPVSQSSNQGLQSNTSQPINATQSGPEGSNGQGEVIPDNINRTTVTQTSILIVTLCFGIIFLLAMIVVSGKRWCEGYHRRKYNKVDYLINGYYS
ncbi:MANSC domain-containing protein 1-like [Lytechinus variegatus]|uniref:MANSC domain-containing protein 1-like n=1 Tax=Lytechinus variegatus TaxID=7654 RepID=UPI001BB182EF|nr:MANSC domain-containing protein 1-like [Lytechinus variegatus]